MTTHYGCTGCGRTFTNKREEVARLVARGASRCKFCGGELEFPDEARALVAAPATIDVGWNPEEQIACTCSQCSRTYSQKLLRLVERVAGSRARCQLCGGSLVLPPRVYDALEELRSHGVLTEPTRVQCLLCARESALEGGDRGRLLTCATCGASYLPPREGSGPGRPAPTGAPAADPREADGADGWVGRVLRARAQEGSLEAGEARLLQAGFGALRAWEPEPEALHLPLDPALAEPLVGSLLFPGRPHTVGRFEEGIELIYVVKKSSGGKLASDLGSTLFVNVLGTISLMTVGVGLFRRGAKDEVGEGDVHRLRLGVRRSRSGVGVDLELWTQLNADRPQAAPAKALRQLGEALAGTRDVVLAYLGALTLFGPSAAGSRAFSITPEAVAARLAALGVSDAVRDAALVCPGRTPRPGS